MEIWVQYTLDLSKNKPDGLLTLGGWATREICYKFVTKVNSRNAGGYTNQKEIPEDEDRQKAIANILSKELDKKATLYQHIELKHADQFKKVFNIYETKYVRQKYSNSIIHTTYTNILHPGRSKCNINATPEKLQLIGLAIFIRSSPIHLSSSLRDELKSLGLIPD